MEKNRNNYRSHWRCDYQLYFWLILKTHQNKPCLTEAMLKRLEGISRKQCDRWGISLFDFKGSVNQAELFLDIHPNVVPSRFINSLKTVTSRLLAKEFAENIKTNDSKKNVLWDRGYTLKTIIA